MDEDLLKEESEIQEIGNSIASMLEGYRLTSIGIALEKVLLSVIIGIFGPTATKERIESFYKSVSKRAVQCFDALQAQENNQTLDKE